MNHRAISTHSSAPRLPPTHFNQLVFKLFLNSLDMAMVNLDCLPEIKRGKRDD